MPGEDVLISYILKAIGTKKDLSGKKLLVTAGPTCGAIDPVRYITNHSTGKMGYAVAYRAMLRGADVTLISGKTSLTPPPFINLVNITSADDMCKAVKEHFESADITVMSAAVADFRPAVISNEKIKKAGGCMSIALEKTEDILSYICKIKRENQFVCGFSMETENLIENSRQKLIKKNCDMIAANNLKQYGAGFGTDTNILTLITKDSTD